MQNSIDQPVELEQLAAALRGLFSISQMQTFAAPEAGIQFTGQLLGDVDAVYPVMRERLEALGYTVFLMQEGSCQVVQAIKGITKPRPLNIWINLALFLLTCLSILFTGALQELAAPASGKQVSLEQIITALWTQPQNLLLGLPFAFTVMVILGSHEMGHYIVARRHKADVSLPYFIPLPLVSPFGTLGAVIVQRSPFENRQSLFDVGLAGPLAGLIVATPLLIIGLANSQVRPYTFEAGSFFEGNSLFYLAVKFLVHGQLLPANGLDVFLSPMAFAAWFGLIVTFLNLLPIGQLDGGHVLYALLGRRAWPIAALASRLLLLMGLLGVAGEFLHIPLLAYNFWSGWLIWGILTSLMRPQHPPPLNDVSGLGPKRKAVGVLAVVLFFLLFTRVPISAVPVLF